MGFGFQQQQQHSVQRSLVHESSIRSPIRTQSRRPTKAPTLSNCERGRMTLELLDHEYSRGGHSALSIHFFLTLSGEANTQTRCGRTGTSRHEDTCLLASRKTKQNQSFHRVERPQIAWETLQPWSNNTMRNRAQGLTQSRKCGCSTKRLFRNTTPNHNPFPGTHHNGGTTTSATSQLGKEGQDAPPYIPPPIPYSLATHTIMRPPTMSTGDGQPTTFVTRSAGLSSIVWRIQP